ncbi:ANTAR domain-containing protein [Pseudonocardia phyllosphaerae]|uniref:ANTAR domain-containing protein n=1 Tax=Pseudonocardia phyllosphaerae TaxID=3390502 RepID=UPI00397CF135
MLSGSSDAHRILRACRADPAFRATRSPYLLIDPDLRIAGANPAFGYAVLRDPDTLVDQQLFEAFPAPPHQPDAAGRELVAASIERVLREGRRDRLPVLRYDIPAPDGDGFLERMWLVVNSPVDDGRGQVVGVLNHVEDVTALLGTSGTDGPGTVAGQACSALLHSLEAENRTLRDRFARHVTIEQAKGVLMARRGCDADEAFTLLRKLSHETNKKVHVVAEALLAGAASDPDRPS